MFNITLIKEIFSFIFLLPAIITLAILSPWLIYSAYKSYKEKKEKAENQSQDDDSQKQTTTPDQPLEQLDFHITLLSLYMR